MAVLKFANLLHVGV